MGCWCKAKEVNLSCCRKSHLPPPAPSLHFPVSPGAHLPTGGSTKLNPLFPTPCPRFNSTRKEAEPLFGPSTASHPNSSLWAAAAAAKSFQLCLTLCDPIDGSPPGFLGFSKQEHWSGLPFPSPMHESEK